MDRILKTAFYLSVAAILFLLGVGVGHFQWWPWSQLKTAQGLFETAWTEREVMTGRRPVHFLQPARGRGAGVTTNTFTPGTGGLILMAGFFGQDNALVLMDRSGTELRRWNVRFSEIYADGRESALRPATDWNVDLNGVLAEPDGSVLFNFEYGGLVKLDRCGVLLWTVERMTHHSIVPSHRGGYWVPATHHESDASSTPYAPFLPPYYADSILKISADGEVEGVLPVPQLLLENGLLPLLTATGERFMPDMAWDHEIVHLNKIAELGPELADQFPDFETGDLLLSIRNYNLLLVADPFKRKVKWWQVGPWLRQHDPDFADGGALVVFNNNMFLNEDPHASDWGSSLLRYTFATGRTEVLYGATREQPLRTSIRGELDATPGGWLLTEFDGGRVLEVDGAGQITWEYVNAWDDHQVAEISEAKWYPQDFFEVEDWNCPGR